MISRTLDTDGEAANGTRTRSLADMTLVDIARELETVTSRIEAERERERQARAVYQAVATEVEAKVRHIREHAQTLVDEQRRRMTSFDGFLGRRGQAAAELESKPPPDEADENQRSLGPAILRIWSLEKYRRPLTTDQIVTALKEVGYQTRAAPRSLKSALNQTLAKLCREGKIKKFRLDGQPIDPGDSASRARRYMAVRSS